MREVFKDIFPAIAQKVLNISSGQYKALPVDLQYTSEREADQLWEVIHGTGQAFGLHCEFQSTNDKQMLSRMLLYYVFLHYQKKLPIRQFVIYVGKDRLQMEHQLQSDSLSYQYQLIDLRSFSYQTFLNSVYSQEVLLAILADFKGEPAELIAEKIIVKLQQLSGGKLELVQRTLQLVRLAVLRNLGETVFNLANQMSITLDIKEDTLYQKGQEKAALNMLREGFSQEVVARLTELPVERVAQLKQELDASRNPS